MPLHKVALIAFVTLITMVNPLAVIPSFITLTDRSSRAARKQIAAIAGVATTGVLLVFLLAGNYVFKFFGITVPAFQIMGGIIFFVNALRTLMEDERRLRNVGSRADGAVEEGNVADVATAADPATIAIVPLAVPMLSGPGAITSVMVLVNLYPGLAQKMALIAALAAVGIVSWLALLAAVPISRFIGERGRLVFSKVMALLLGAIGVQFVLNGLKPLMIEILKAS